MSKVCGLVIGHSQHSQGASNADGTTEYGFNLSLANKVADEILDRQIHQLEIAKGVYVVLIERGSYRYLPKKINQKYVDFVISMHCNAFNKKATGTETLYYHTFLEGKRLATMLQRNMVNALGLPDRGIKPKRTEDRGGYLLRYTNATCVIAEPFFIDNPQDLMRARTSSGDRLVRAYADTILEYANS